MTLAIVSVSPSDNLGRSVSQKTSSNIKKAFLKLIQCLKRVAMVTLSLVLIPVLIAGAVVSTVVLGMGGILVGIYSAIRYALFKVRNVEKNRASQDILIEPKSIENSELSTTQPILNVSKSIEENKIQSSILKNDGLSEKSGMLTQSISNSSELIEDSKQLTLVNPLRCEINANREVMPSPPSMDRLEKEVSDTFNEDSF